MNGNQTDLICRMIGYYTHDPKRISHFLKVHALSKLIGARECLDERSQYILETAAIVHDIGIKSAEEKYGKCDGNLQEKEGPAVAEEMLYSLNFDSEVIEWVSYLVGHHHTYSCISGKDYQILVEADFLVNFDEENYSDQQIDSVFEKLFKTASGREICREMYVF